jgi:hypothetical protein
MSEDTITAATIMLPPATAEREGFSRVTRKTQTGLSTGYRVEVRRA